MRNHKKLLLEQLDRKLLPFKKVDKIQVPENGWINNIRNSLNMTLEQLGGKLNITRQGMKGIEDREVSGSITIKSLKEVGEVLDMKLVYGFVPKDSSVIKMVDRKAKKLAQKIVFRTHQNMKLENQGNSDKQIRKAVKDLTEVIKDEMRKSLWD